MAFHPSFVLFAIFFVTIEATESLGRSHSQENYYGRIIGGREANISDFPYQAMIERNVGAKYGGYLCGGSILSEIYVLTTAVCLHFPRSMVKISLEELTVRAGSSVPESGGQVVRLLAYNIHPKYRGEETSYDYDIAIPKVEALSFTNTVKPIALPTGSEIPDGTRAQVTGYGYAGPYPKFSSPFQVIGSEDTVKPIALPVGSDILAGTQAQMTGYGYKAPLWSHLRVLDVNVLNLAECKKNYSSINAVLSDRMLCAGVDGAKERPCAGDSGDPLVVKGVQYGIYSLGIGCVYHPSYQGVYSSVVALRSYITDITGL